jgi:hypothetical protein
MSRYISRRALVGLVVLVVIWGVLVGLRFFMSRHDYEQVLRGRRPRFARETWFLSDGGTVVYRGLGYDLTAQHRFHVEANVAIGYDRGPILKYWLNWLLLPLSDKKEIRFEKRELQCTTNFSYIFRGIVSYAWERQGAFPPDLQALVEIGATHPRTLQCPDRSDPRSCDYFYLPPEGVFNVGFDGAETRPAAPPDALVLCDYEGNHEGGRHVAFATGHVKWLTEEEFQADLAKPVNAAFAAALRKAEAGAADSRPASATSSPSTRPS